MFPLIFYAILTTADDHYYECFDHKTCHDIYDHKIYCYAGTCTDRCPPGYIQDNIARNRSFTCQCDTGKYFVANGTFGGDFQKLSIPKCMCNQTFCLVTVWAEGIGYTDGLVPKGSPPNCKINSDEIPNFLTEFSFFLMISTMIIFLFVTCRSTSGVIYDFYRYYSIYVLASMAVVVFVLTVTPFSAGFTRTMAFGIVAHNSAEWNLLLRLHFGKTAYVRNSTNVCVIIYYIVLLLLMVILPLPLLLYVAMVQGGFLDFTLFLFMFVARKSIKQDDNCENASKKCCGNVYSRFIFWYGFGAFFHLVTVEILFTGFILNAGSLIGLGSFFLLPTFFCYIIWVYSEEHYMLFFGPSLIKNYNKNYKTQSNMLLIPFRHTTQVVDILWKNLVGGYKPIHKDDVELYNLEDAKFKPANEDELIKYIAEESRRTRFQVEDCENFKFGIHEHVRKCHCGKNCSCCAWIPLYWVAGFISISVNAALIIILPMFDPKSGCSKGFDYGAW